MESSEDEDDFPAIESVTPQAKIDSIYQSKTEKEIRKLCFDLLDLKDAVENLCGNSRTKYLAFLRLSEEVVETEHELNELRKHISGQGILVQDLMTGVCHELDQWNSLLQDDKHVENSNVDDTLSNEGQDYDVIFLENIDVLLAEHKVFEAIEALDAEEKSHPQLKILVDASSVESGYKPAFLKRKEILENQLVGIIEQPMVGRSEKKKALCGLLKLGKGSMAHQFLLQTYVSSLQKSIEEFLPLCSSYPETYSATLSNLIFSRISLLAKESAEIFGNNPIYSNKVIRWAECEIEALVRLVKENAPLSETVYALRAASICIQASLTHCSTLESQGIKLSELLLVLFKSYIEEIFELNFRRARKTVLTFDSTEDPESLSLSPRFAYSLSSFALSSGNSTIDSGMRFIFTVKELVEQLTPQVILHFGGNILTRISQLFDKYVDALIKALAGPSEDENLLELKEISPFRAETDAEQLALLGTAFTVAEELLPMVVSRIWSALNEKGEVATENIGSTTNTTELKDWRRHLQHSLDKLRDHFCRQYVLNFIYSRDGRTRLDAQIYLIEKKGDKENLFWNSDPLPSLPFQALFGKLQQLATVAGDVLPGKEKIQKILLARLTETVVMWLSNEQEFWGVLEDESTRLQPIGLQQLILDMHFTVEIARYAGYPSRHIHQLASAIIARAIRTFADRGIDPQSSLPEDEWFGETAKNAINKLLHGGSGSETSEIDEDHLIIQEGEEEEEEEVEEGHMMSDSEEGSPSSLSSEDYSDSFASAQTGELEDPSDLSDQEG
ncbi:exocyst complex component EXO84C [Impatiens glandulifera]|uniref:exocyst complex component EXO84C n=1 Tax=Impatiens glandulifera TaxID=253017 RepID=UPI001FB0D685|nr:exocyst complex component EXO84C [Impatiens glandulifera]